MAPAPRDSFCSWRSMTAADLISVSAIAAIIHPDFLEGDAVFANRLALHPGGCAVLDSKEGLAGYTLSHPWHHLAPPPLDAVLTPPDLPSTYYIHDLALLPETRGAGTGAAIVARLAAHACALALPNMTLVAVNNSVHFWQRQGFTVLQDDDLAEKLNSYGDDARYMVRNLTP